MEFFHGAIALLAAVVLILAGLVAWLYVQQSRTVQAMNTLALAITAPPPEIHQVHVEPAVQTEQPIAEADDRVSVYEEDDGETTVEEEQAVEASAEHDDDLSSKTVSQLRDILTSKGIPYNKKDSKPVLLALIKATS